MRNVYLFMLTSLDGYFEGPDHDISWFNYNEELDRFSLEQTSQAGTLLFGRVTYEMMASYWPQESAKDENPVELVRLMNDLEKVVFSRTLKQVDWQNARLAEGDAADEVRRLKQGEGKEIAIFGSSDLAASLLDAGLIDELRIMVNPVVLGEGKPLLAGLQRKPATLERVDTRFFENGNVLHYYRPRA